MEWQCKHKHTYFAQREYLSKPDVGAPLGNGNKDSIEEIQQLTKDKGVELLVNRIQRLTKLLWQCGKV